MSGLDLTLDAEWQHRRFEVINGAGGRRHWSMDERAWTIAETLAQRNHFRSRPVLWSQAAAGARKQAASVQQESPAFVPAVVTAPPPEPASTRLALPRKQKTARDAGVIELEIDDTAMRRGRELTPRRSRR